MRIVLRRTWVCLRLCGLAAVGAVVAHLAAAGVGEPERVAPMVAATKAADQTSDRSVETNNSVGEPGARSPLPGSSVDTDLNSRLADKGMSPGSPIMIRIFKAESQLELWMRSGERFELFASYPICRWSGTLGPKRHEGDKQAPEGVYSVTEPQIHRKGRWPRSLNIGYPNAFDRAMERTGSLILVHGGCTSTGCYAMTNPVMEEIYKLSERALHGGQERIPVHVFPFRMTEANLAAHADSEWQPFWRNIKEAYDVFERTRVPPAVSVCGKRYVVSEGVLSGEVHVAAVGSSGGEPGDCVDAQASSGLQGAGQDAAETKMLTAKARKVVSKTQKRRSAGRNARKAYAEARKSRVSAHAERARAKQAAAKRTQQ